MISLQFVQVVPETPLQKASGLVNVVLREKNACRSMSAWPVCACVNGVFLGRGLAFKLKPIKMSETLIQQLLALEKKFNEKAFN